MNSSFFDHAFAHAADALREATMHTEPFTWAHVHNVFPDDFYTALLANKPALPEYLRLLDTGRVLGDYSPERYVVDSDTEQVNGLSEPARSFWAGTFRALNTQAMAESCLTAFNQVLGERFANAESNSVSMSVHWNSLLVRDRGKYVLYPHSDHPTKLVSLLFYLPDSNQASELGTTLFRLKDGVEQPLDDGSGYPFEMFDAVHTVPFLPNSLFAFAKTSHSYHGVPPVPDELERDLLLFNVRWTPTAGLNVPDAGDAAPRT